MPCAGDDLRRTAIGIQDVVAYSRYAHRASIFQLELQRPCPLMDHPAVTGVAALGCAPEDCDSRMSVDVSLLLTHNHLSVLMELRNLLLSEVWIVQTAQIL
ncbi:hypothetical protein D3C78_1422090 [compost metagenome]